MSSNFCAKSGRLTVGGGGGTDALGMTEDDEEARDAVLDCEGESSSEDDGMDEEDETRGEAAGWAVAGWEGAGILGTGSITLGIFGTEREDTIEGKAIPDADLRRGRVVSMGGFWCMVKRLGRW
jgi:hypothetical protein